jgi:hypothetical protein
MSLASESYNMYEAIPDIPDRGHLQTDERPKVMRSIERGGGRANKESTETIYRLAVNRDRDAALLCAAYHLYDPTTVHER